MQGPSFERTPVEAAIISKIADRAVAMNANNPNRANDNFGRMDVEMDLCAVHANGNPLRLEALLEADDFNFCHDIYGIRRHLDRDTGKLGDFFSPRFSRVS